MIARSHQVLAADNKSLLKGALVSLETRQKVHFLTFFDIFQAVRFGTIFDLGQLFFY